MTVAWIVYTLVVGALLAATARWLESACRLAGRPARWVWAASLGTTVALAALAPHRAQPPRALDISLPTPTSITAVASAPQPRSILDALRTAETATIASTQRAMARLDRLVPARLGRGLGAAWMIASAALLLLFTAVSVRYARARRRWPVAELHGERVRIAPEAGPAVVGLSKPEIVVPRWFLARSDDEQRLVLLHEREHVLARDPLVLAAACAAVALLPWHPAVWWMLSRLQLAVELDCDERVLRRGVARRSYGTLLIDLAGRSSGLPVGAPALADRPSHLERRLLAMQPIRPRFARTRGGLLAALATLALVAACEAKMPTSAEVADMDVAKAEAGAHRVSFMKMSDSTATYTVDGKVVSSAEARAITPQNIAAIRVEKKNVNGVETGAINITTRAAAGLPPAGPNDSGAVRIMVRHDSTMRDGDALANSAYKVHVEGGPMPGDHSAMRNFDGVIMIDGVRVNQAALASLSPSDIVSMDVIKGAAAERESSAPEAKNGIIKITTKKGAQH